MPRAASSGRFRRALDKEVTVEGTEERGDEHVEAVVDATSVPPPPLTFFTPGWRCPRLTLRTEAVEGAAAGGATAGAEARCSVGCGAARHWCQSASAQRVARCSARSTR
mmetsp:Transcript_51829/g.150561  ORF Transcript_51829/g.150561 Transcript_51829/m.150561 type:complete len:109 (-) Transcript_51829:343-669(-)